MKNSGLQFCIEMKSKKVLSPNNLQQWCISFFSKSKILLPVTCDFSNSRIIVFFMPFQNIVIEAHMLKAMRASHLFCN